MHPKQNQAVILDPSSFFAELGGLHDARIQQIASGRLTFGFSSAALRKHQ